MTTQNEQTAPLFVVEHTENTFFLKVGGSEVVEESNTGTKNLKNNSKLLHSVVRLSFISPNLAFSHEN